MELTKKNCEQALKDWTFEVMRNHNNILFDCLSNKHVLKSRFQRQHDLLEQLIKEHFDFLERNKHNNKPLIECDKIELLDCIKVLCYRIDELNSNQPLKLKDIEEEDVIWDDHSKEYVLVRTLLDDNELELAYFDYNHQKVKFKKGRFYRKEVKE